MVRYTRTIVFLGLLLLFPPAMAAYDPACTADADCWAQALGKASGVQYTGASCNEFCIENHGPQSTGNLANNVCQCQCKPGFTEDRSLVCVRSAGSCYQDCKNYHAGSVYGTNAYGTVVNGVCECRCREGYGPDDTLACVETFSEDDFKEIPDEDQTLETFTAKCQDLREYVRGGGESFTVTEAELLDYLKRVESANPGSSWKQIIAALHVSQYPDDAFNKKLPVLGTPLFEWGPETEGWQKVNLLCRAPLRTVTRNPPWYTPKFVRTDDGSLIELGHAFGAIRVNLNRAGSSNGTFISDDQWVWILTHGGDYWQVAVNLGNHNYLPPDQFLGNEMGIWLEHYYRQNNVPLSESFQAYFTDRPYLGKRKASLVWTIGEIKDSVTKITGIPFF